MSRPQQVKLNALATAEKDNVQAMQRQYGTNAGVEAGMAWATAAVTRARIKLQPASMTGGHQLMQVYDEIVKFAETIANLEGQYR